MLRLVYCCFVGFRARAQFSTSRYEFCAILTQGVTKFDLYHDESKEVGYWHGMLLVPRATRANLLIHLETIRRNTQISSPITLKGLDRETGRHYRCIRAWLTLGVQSLAQRGKGKSLPFETGFQTRDAHFAYLEQPIKARFILFRVKDDHASMKGYRDHCQKVETSFCMGLKGGLHLFTRPDDQIVLRGFHFDGHQHYRRHIDRDGIVQKLSPKLRSGICFASDFSIDDRSSDHRMDHAQSYDDCQLLQLTDLLVSGFRTVLGCATNDAQMNVAAPLRRLAEKWHQGYARMRNSRWFGGFCISECWLENNGWRFSDIRPALSRQQMVMTYCER